MSDHESTNNIQPPSRRNLLLGTLLTAVAAVVILVTVVLPAGYGLDPTGVGRALGLTELADEPTRTIEIRDVTGGNEALSEAEIPDYGEPVPLPNPAVFQAQDAPPASRTLTITIPAERETEIKAYLPEGKVILFSWEVDRGTVYSDFHGHDPSFGDQFFVRYEEHQEGSGSHGSLTAPFSGEHGWYWLNYNDHPVEVTLTVNGYYEEIIDYGLF